MSLFNLPVEHNTKTSEPAHRKEKIKEHYANKIKRAHNSVRNVAYRNPKEKIPCQERVTFTVIGNRTTKEFVYCVNLVQGMHKYRWKSYDTPIIKECSGVEWADHLRNIQIQYGILARALQSQVVVLCDNKYIGGEKELKDLIESKYIYHQALNYQKEIIKKFTNYLKSSSRPCAYMHISINGKPIGSLIFMLYSDVVPTTCENFLQLCKARRGGYSGTPIHRVVKNGWIQGGGFGLKSNNMDCENFIVPHDKRGVLGMANAGRHIDCSTQFYILLQPNDWLSAHHRFVAFGQLVEGEETLKKIEEVETYYESPTANIVIYSAGVVDLDCHDIIINKGATAYLDGHIEDLITIGELFYEMLMEWVFLEIEFKEIQRSEPPREEDERKYRETFRNDVKHCSQSTHSNDTKNNENNDFEEDIYGYEPEASNTQMTPRSPLVPIHKGTKPYFIALTDEPYPGEVDSNFDLKRLLQGDYCLEADLDRKVRRKVHDTWRHERRIKAISNIIDNCCRDLDDLEMESEGSSIESNEVSEIQDYIRNHQEEVSFSGMRVKSIAQKAFQINPIKLREPHEKFSDEDIRIMRWALRESKTKKKVTIKADPLKKSHHIQRRQTAYALPKEAIQALEEKAVTEVEKEKEETTKMHLDSRRLSKPRKSRQSVLERLFEEVTVKYDAEPLPTPKDNTPIEVKRKSLQLALPPADFQKNSIHRDSNQSERTETRDKVDEHPIIRARLESKKKKTGRPSLTVSQYRRMNDDKREEIKIIAKKLEELNMYKGSLRLPGDTPLYSPDNLSIVSTGR